MVMTVKAGLPGKIDVAIDGVSYQLEHSADLYNGLHALAEQVTAAAEPAPAPVPAPADEVAQ